MPSLDQSAERIIYITHTRGSGSARIEVFPAKQQDRIGLTTSDPGVAVWRSDNSRS
jgi:hypothetical protein